jgi:nitrate reductase assembly molybdenum cofactor insertion protein NarJ
MLGFMRVADDIQRVAVLLQRPRPAYLKRLDEALQVLAGRSVEVSRQLEIFADRVGDLTAEELRELYDETFRNEDPAIRRTLGRLVRSRTDDAAAGAAVSALQPFLARLDAERNPLAHIVRSLCWLLLQRLQTPHFEKSRS